MSLSLAKVKLGEAQTALRAAQAALAGAATLMESDEDCGLSAAVMLATANAVGQVAHCCQLTANAL